jgi:pimeloyl-ACP methyl ester carboxylesterase
MEQTIRFCTTPDKVRIAYATVGQGYPLVKAANWLNHLEFDWQSPIWRPLLDELARDHFLVRYDERGNGLSDWDVDELSLDVFVSDLEAVIEASGVERFALLGISQGGPVSVAYAVRHPERVSHLILYGAYARGWNRRGEKPEVLEVRDAMQTLVRLGWGRNNPAFRQLFTSLYVPGATPEQAEWFTELQKISTSPENAVRLMTTLSNLDVSELLEKVRTPTLVLHRRDEAVVPFKEGRSLAAGIPGARLVTLPGQNHLVLPDEPAFEMLMAEIRAFLGTGGREERRARSVSSEFSSGTPSRGQSSAATLAPGTRMEHHRIVALLGAGGMGCVYRAHDERLDREVALKVLHSAGAGDRVAQARLLREARTASKLNHPNIATIYQVGEAGGQHYISMELVEGTPLSRAIPAEGLSPATVVRYGAQIADALAHAHARGVVHRDLKCANLVLTPEGRAKVLDFGLARRIAWSEADEATRTKLSESGAIAGTMSYMAPEVLRGEPADARSDIWALGVVLYEMAAAALPFRGRTPFEITSAILREPPAPLPASLPAGLAAVVLRCLEKPPGERYQTAGEIRAALEAVT